MSKQELLEECISLAYKINKFGAFVFASVSPQVKMTNFMFHLNGWTIDCDCGFSFIVRIYEDYGYGEFEHNWKDNQPNNVEELHLFLTNLLKEKEGIDNE